MLKKKYVWLIIGLLIIAAIGLILYWLAVESTIYYTAGWIIAVLVLLILGNAIITIQFDKYFPWLKYGGLRLFSHLFLGIIFSLIIMNVAYYVFKVLFTVDPPTYEQLVVMNVYGVVIFIPLYAIYFSFQFLSHWRKSEVAAEKFRKEHLKSQLDSLKNHLDPHFLFNNLNILSSLIDQDQDLSKKFLDNFAQVYRTILKTKDDDLITLKEELEFIDSYLFLIKTRFENIIITTNIDQVQLNMSLPPLSLQLLIENVFKHNMISESAPLEILIESQPNNYLKVSNSLNERAGSKKESTGSGLQNIINRYAYFTDKKITVNKSNNNFAVTVPLVKIETL